MSTSAVPTFATQVLPNTFSGPSGKPPAATLVAANAPGVHAQVSPAAGSKAAGGGTLAQSSPASRYQRVIVIDSFKEPGISINPSDKVPDLSHGDVVRAIIDTGLNGSRQPGQAGYVPIESIALESFASADDAAAPILGALRQVLQTAPRDGQGRPDLRGVAINLSRSLYGGEGLKPAETGVLSQVLAAGADLFISESNISPGLPNHLGAVADAPGGGRLFFVGGSDAKLFRNPSSGVPSTQNAWSVFSRPGSVNSVVNSDLLSRAVDANGDAKSDGFDIDGDGRPDLPKSLVKDTSALDKPFVGKELAKVKVGLDDLNALENKIATALEANIPSDVMRKADTDEGHQRLLDMATQIRDKYGAELKGKLVSVDDVIAFNLGADNKTEPTMLLGSMFRLDQHVPRGLSIDPRQLYVSVDALLSGPIESRYRDDIVFFTAGADGRVVRLTDAPGTSGHTPSANSWAAPYKLLEEALRRAD